ncbi:hypothetical protein GCM10010232_07650 [Streptomyces amakusaensis]|uniref:Condensation domain-containing protein n=1 Tax=Streptomyces amakusaensis TaxID=67271 RepID=A0ABW0AC94_9ACTN
MSTAHSDDTLQVPLSFNQDFLCLYDQGDDAGPFGPRYHIVHGWRVRGAVDHAALRGALDDVVERHEALRTAVIRNGDERYQRIHPPASPELTVRDLPATDPALRDELVENLLIEAERGTFDSLRIPHLRAVLARFTDTDAVLVLTAHHTATDGWSMRLIMRDLAHRYAVRRGHELPELPEALPYREFAQWEREQSQTPAADAARAYWRDRLRGARIVTIGTDHPRSAGLEQTTGMHRFLIERETMTAALELARKNRSSPFMVLMAAFQVLICRTTDVTEVTVPTFSPGRGPDRFQQTVGSFFNFMPVRTDLEGCATFREALARVRKSCISAYAHDMPQIPAEAPEMMAPAMADDRATCVFQVFPFPFVLDGDAIGDLTYTEVRRRLVSQPLASDIPDGSLWTLNLDPDGDVVASVAYKRSLYDPATVAALATGYRETLRELVAEPDAPLHLTPGRAPAERV